MTLLMEPLTSVVCERKMYTTFVPVDDAELEEKIEKIKRFVRHETNRGVQEMRVSMKNGKFVLAGHCRTFYTKQLAQQAAMKVIGADELINEIHVA